MRKKSSPSDRHSQAAHLHDMLESAESVARYMSGVTFEQFWNDCEKRDAVALRLSMIGEAARHVADKTAAALPAVPFKAIRGMRNRITHDYGAIDFRIIWEVTQQDIAPLVAELSLHLTPGKTVAGETHDATLP